MSRWKKQPHIKARCRFMKMFKGLPEGARKYLVFDAYSDNPMTLNVIWIEVKNKTKKGDQILIDLGYLE